MKKIDSNYNSTHRIETVGELRRFLEPFMDEMEIETVDGISSLTIYYKRQTKKRAARLLFLYPYMSASPEDFK